MEWIDVNDLLPPKNIKFLFNYYCGTGIGEWGQCFTVTNGNSERTHKCYILILNPSLLVGNQEEPFEWDEKKMIEMEVSWMHLPKPPENK